jgi:2,3-diaminopropionate biosynthesis protein SbnB
MPGGLTILGGEEIRRLLNGSAAVVTDIVREAYTLHGDGQSALPQSVFLRFEDQPRNRMIALPAYVGGRRASAGMKWISSFPDNVARGVERASGVVILNGLDTGWPIAVLEGSIISAKRTAASATLAAQHLRAPDTEPLLGLIGCGRINYEVATFIGTLMPDVRTLLLFDLDVPRAETLRGMLERHGLRATIAASRDEVLARAPIVSFATTASTPYLMALPAHPPGALWLHLSLRDVAPEIVLAVDNVVDDPEHVCRERTSLHLAEMQVRHRQFIRTTLADVMQRRELARRSIDAPVLFSPFGLGVLDIAVAAHVLELALAEGAGQRVDDFQPRAWLNP